MPAEMLAVSDLLECVRPPAEAPLALPAIGGALRSPEGPC